MAVHIRHGAPGSYKTAAAVWLDILQWLRDGRVVYTNIRGMLSVAEIEDALKTKFPDSAELHAVDTDSHDARHSFAAWFHWLPLGAAICIDEGQFVYPDRRDFKAESLDYPGGLDAATRDQRPPDIYTAIDKHRHYNWDVSVTTPNIRKLPTWLRGVVESAYHHKAMDHVPFWGKRKARIHRHDASTGGTSINKQSQYEFKKIPVAVHSLYGSTITGEITQNRAEANPLKNPRFISVMALAVIAVAALPFIMSSGDAADTLPDSPGGDVDPGVSGASLALQDAPSRADRVGGGEPRATREAWAVIRSYLPGVNGLFITGSWTTSEGTHYLYKVVSEMGDTIISEQFLQGAGFEVAALSDCAHDVTHPDLSTALRVLCVPPRQHGGASREPSERATPAVENLPDLPTLSSINPVGYRQ